jgi:imidazolonepropionase-like amidohydrolase
MLEAHPIHREGVKLAKELGVKIMIGTDYPGSAREWERGEATSYEMMELQKCGFTPMELIVAATKTNAEGYGKENEIGTIEKGKCADIVILKVSPLEDIAVLHDKENIACVLRDGIVEYANLQYRDHLSLEY